MNEHRIPLKKRVLKAGSWTLFGHGAALVFRLVGNLIIARLLAPEIFGVMAVCNAIYVIVVLVGDIGLRPAVIRSLNGNDPPFLNTAWTIQILRGVTIWIVCIGVGLLLLLADTYAALPSDSIYSDPTLPYLISAIGFSTIIQSLQSMKVMVLSRELQLSRITTIEMIQTVTGFSVAILMAWTTGSIWSFVASGLVGSIVGVSIGHFWLPGARDRLGWNKSAIRELAHFGKWASVSSFVGVLASNGDRLLLGSWLSASNMGAYSIASNLASVVDGVGSRLFASVSLPALSETLRHQPDRLRSVLFRMRRGADAAYIGSAGFLFATGQFIVEHLYDQRYSPAGKMLQLLSFNLLLARYGLVQDAYIALGKPSHLTAINVTKLISLFTMVPLLYHFFAVNGAILGMAVYLLPTVPLIFWFNHRHGLNNGWFEILILGLWPVGWIVGYAGIRLLSTGFL
jgi:O-antigen/teichoic acid export membrane protein